MPPWIIEGAEPNVDMWASPDESRAEIVGLYRRALAHSDATIGGLALEAVGQVPHWPRDRAEITLHRVLVHVTAETHRHAGHADIVREQIDGAVGMRADQAWWAAHRDRVEWAARAAGRR